ncbi:acyl-CoA/acyl-ACP dehydrogenase [Geodermatophilus sp. YIM 151500]|uniref:acyl-CoA dehydrogenase family protein n=1 Tax=Geodermatophilus sp. YIM 151500 TaxID=2984531 RepID=UPI0021E43882|nr:acyl-CoA dehydrogenase family protein [Geodermatophilus sp. YIM 151500]MCV2489317.1 acyl-CoA/acyl-ACP dehydrogenase [Geodermatophilus sp. YIM 151500]
MDTSTLPRILPRTRSLPEELLLRFRERAADHDAAGVVAADDLAELRAAGWFRAALPDDLGGSGLDLAGLGAEQRRMARYSPATALSTCMHHYWVGLAADLRRMGRPEADLVTGYVTDGDVLASGHAEVGNDVPIALSTTSATRVDGGWRITGRKMFGSLGEHWDRLGFHAMDAGDPAAPVVVHGFVPRGAPGLTTVRNWDAQGMRATESHDTVLDGVVVPDADVLCVVPAGPPSHPAVAVMQVWALTLIANVYVGIAERALEIAVAQANRRTSIAVPRSTFAHHPLVQHQVADMYLALDAARACVDAVARDWGAGVDHGPMWGPKVLAAKWQATMAANRVGDLAFEVVGGSAYRRGTELERLSRDVRAARFHPGTDAFTHETVGKALLGVDRTGPRW